MAHEYDDMSLLGLMSCVHKYVRLPGSLQDRVGKVVDEIRESGWRGTDLSSNTRMIIVNALGSAMGDLPPPLAARAGEFISDMARASPSDNAPVEYKCLPGYSSDNVYNTTQFISAFVKLTRTQVERIHDQVLTRSAFVSASDTRSSLRPCGVKPERLMEVAIATQALALVDCLKQCNITLFFYLFALSG